MATTANNTIRVWLKNLDIATGPTREKFHETQIAFSQALSAISCRLAAADIIDEFNIRVPAEGEVELFLGCKHRLDLLEAAQIWSKQHRGQELIPEDTLKTWRKDYRFNGFIPAASGLISVKVDMLESQINISDFQDLPVAQVAYFLATGKDLFEGHSAAADLIYQVLI